MRLFALFMNLVITKKYCVHLYLEAIQSWLQNQKANSQHQKIGSAKDMRAEQKEFKSC